MFRLTKKQKFWLSAICLLLLMTATVPLAIWVTHTSGAQLENSRRRCERQEGATRHVIIKDGVVSPAHISAKLCEKLVITNRDDSSRLMAFGRHGSHISYDGVSERLLGPGESLRVTLIKSGSYLFHDHEHEDIRGTFTVSP